MTTSASQAEPRNPLSAITNGGTATASYVRCLLPVMEAAGWTADTFCNLLGIDRELLHDIDARLPTGLISKAWDIAVEVVGHHDLGLLASSYAPPGALPIVDHIAANVPTIFDSLRSFARYYRLCDDETVLSCEAVSEGAALQFRSPTWCRQSRHGAAFLVGLVVGRIRHWASNVAVNPLVVTFQEPAPLCGTALRTMLNCRLVFGGRTTSITFGYSTLALKLPDASLCLGRVVSRHGEAAIQQLGPGERFTDRIRRSLTDMLAVEAPQIVALARKAHCSVRTIQTRLKGEGTCYEDVLDNVRCELALQYISDRTLSLTEIALLLKYSEPSSFYRAFKRWTATSPRDYRRLMMSVLEGDASDDASPSCLAPKGSPGWADS